MPNVTTTVYGCSDDLIEFRGDVYGEASVWDSAYLFEGGA